MSNESNGTKASKRKLWRIAKEFGERNRYGISLFLGFLLLFVFLNFVKKTDIPWTDWLLFIFGVVVVALFIRWLFFPLSSGAFYAPVMGWWIFAIGMNINNIVEIGYGALWLVTTLCIWGITYKLFALIERGKNRV